MVHIKISDFDLSIFRRCSICSRVKLRHFVVDVSVLFRDVLIARVLEPSRSSRKMLATINCSFYGRLLNRTFQIS